MLNRVVIDATMPLLLLLVLARARVELSTAEVLLATTVAQGVVGAVAVVVARAFSLPRQAQGSAALTSAFSNTGFLGFPVLLALFGSDARASSTALVVDTVSTTVLLWSVGVAVAARFGGGRAFSARGLVRALVRPMTVCIAVGFALSSADVRMPAATDTLVTVLGGVTSTLVFFSLGLSLDVAALRGRAAPVLAIVALKLLVMPALVLGGMGVLGIAAPVSAVAVLQCAMPTAMVSVIISAEEGCDRAFAAGVAALSTLLCVVTLPLFGWILER